MLRLRPQGLSDRDFLIAAEGATFREALDRLAGLSGVVPEDMDGAARGIEAYARARAAAEASEAERAARGLLMARQIWTASERADPLFESYLAARGIDLDAIGGVLGSLRFSPALAYWASGQIPARDRPAHVGPAMIAAIGRGELVGVHRTWIEATGRARSPDGAKIDKKMIGLSGSIYGEPVRLLTSRLGVVVGEGVETTLAAWSALVRAGPGGRWGAEAALSLGALAGPAASRGRTVPGPDGNPLPSTVPDLRSAAPHWLPAEGVRAVLILGEGSAKGGGEAARRFAERARAKLVARGIEAAVRVLGGRWDIEADFADVAVAEAARAAPER